MASGSLSFDRAAEEYDKTRRLQPGVMREVVALAAEELRPRGRCLEIGVGTGRFAIPLAEAGVSMTGVDLSLDMMAKLRAKDGGRRVRLASADATRMPFADATFGAALVVHVFHLIPRWQDAVAELARVVAPGGTVLVELGGATEPFKSIGDELARVAGLDRKHVGLDVFNDEAARAALDDAFAALGARLRLLGTIVERTEDPLEEGFRWFEQGICSWVWSLDDATRARVAAEVRPWARERFGSLEDPYPLEHPMTWRAYDLPA